MFFDGKLDEMLMKIKRGEKFHAIRQKEEHITITEEPGSKYLGHIVPGKGTASCIATSLEVFLSDKNVELRAIRCDGTDTNTGTKN